MKKIKQTLNYTKELSENYIISHALLRQILFHHTKIHPQKIEFTIGLYGKPYLQSHQKNQHNLQFNMSHSKDMLCIAVTKGDEVGVDIEFKDSKINIEELQNLVLSTQELEYINLLKSRVKQRDFFYDIWTLKEAIVKAAGQGLSYPINQINLIDEATNDKNLSVIKTTTILQERIKLYLISTITPNISLNLNKNYAFAIVSKSIPKNITHIELDAITKDHQPRSFVRTQE